VIGRHVSFISPWGAFMVLGVVVIGIMLQVATFGTYTGTPAQIVQAPLGERYFLDTPARAAADGWAMSRVQATPLVCGLAAIAFVFAARLIEAEAGARKMGLFLYLFVALMIVAVFVAALLGGLT
jgi:ribose transport system permease protein